MIQLHAIIKRQVNIKQDISDKQIIMEHIEIVDSHKGYGIIGFQIPIEDKFINNARIIEFNGYTAFYICDADGESIKSMKHGINACKKFIDDSIRLELISDK